MSRLIKDYVEVGDHQSLDQLIAQLSAIRSRLPEGCGAEVRMRGNDIYGRHLCVVFDRSLTAEEADCEARYASAPRKLKRVA
jgi:hypothetical protein